MQENYTLTDAANLIGVNPAWVNRVQRETGIGPKIGKKGHKVYFDEAMVETLRRIKVLRLLDFGFDEVKGLYKLEEDMLKTEQLLQQEYEVSSISTQHIPLIVHLEKVIAMGPLFVENIEQTTQKLLYKDKNIENYIKYLEQLHAIVKRIVRKKEQFMKHADDVTTLYRVVIEKFPNIF